MLMDRVRHFLLVVLSRRGPAFDAAVTKTLVLIMFGLVLAGGPSASRASGRYQLEVIKSQRLLLVKDGDTIKLRFHVSSGWGGKGDKHMIGDHKTPIGVYRIVKVKDSDRFHVFMQLNYPNVKDAYWGLKRQLITHAEFDAIVDALKDGRAPPQNTELGGAIGIHGLGETDPEKLDIHRAANWTEGCIALTNQQIEQLRHYVDVGTKVVINE